MLPNLPFPQIQKAVVVYGAHHPRDLIPSNHVCRRRRYRSEDKSRRAWKQGQQSAVSSVYWINDRCVWGTAVSFVYEKSVPSSSSWLFRLTLLFPLDFSWLKPKHRLVLLYFFFLPPDVDSQQQVSLESNTESFLFLRHRIRNIRWVLPTCLRIHIFVLVVHKTDSKCQAGTI